MALLLVILMVAHMIMRLDDRGGVGFVRPRGKSYNELRQYKWVVASTARPDPTCNMLRASRHRCLQQVALARSLSWGFPHLRARIHPGFHVL